MTVAAVIPTRDRLDGLRAAVAALRSQEHQPDAIVVVDNSTKRETAQWLVEQHDLTPAAAPVGAGAPAAFQAGIDVALAAGHRWLWLIDDDCVPEDRALGELLAVAAGDADGPVAGVVPTIRFGDEREESGWVVQDGDQRPLERARAGDDVDWAPFAGLLLAADALRVVGPLAADWFLWHADVEICLRLRLGGYRLLAAPAARVWHPLPAEHVRRIGGREVRVADFAPWREYYDTRNRVALHRITRRTRFDERRSTPVRITNELARTAAVMIADPAGMKRTWMRAAGLLDGLRGRMDRHPERDPRWT